MKCCSISGSCQEDKGMLLTTFRAERPGRYRRGELTSAERLSSCFLSECCTGLGSAGYTSRWVS